MGNVRFTERYLLTLFIHLIFIYANIKYILETVNLDLKQ
jgi:hypothetical protein